MIGPSIAAESSGSLHVDPGDGGPTVDCTVKAGACVVLSQEGGTGDISTTLVAFTPPRRSARYLDPVFDAVDVSHDLVYGHAVNSAGVDQQLHLDLYQPAADTNRHRPLMIWVHGGYFTDGDKREMTSLATGMAQRGYVSASLEYRLRPHPSGLGPIRDALADAETAVAWFRQHAADYGIDPNRIAIGGFSAGAFTAVNVGYSADRPNGEPADVRAVVSIAGGLSIGRSDRGEPPALFFHSRDDPVIRYDVGQSSCAQIQAAGPGCTLVTYEGIGHYSIDSDTLLRTSAFLVRVLGLPGR